MFQDACCTFLINNFNNSQSSSISIFYCHHYIIKNAYSIVAVGSFSMDACFMSCWLIVYIYISIIKPYRYFVLNC